MAPMGGNVFNAKLSILSVLGTVVNFKTVNDYKQRPYVKYFHQAISVRFDLIPFEV